MSARSSSTVSNSLASSTHSSVTSGRIFCFASLTIDAEGHFFAGALTETLGERRGELEDRAGARAAELVVELGDDHAGADAVEEVGGGEALERFTVDRAGDVDRRVRVVDQRVLGVGEVGEPLAQRVDLLVDRGVVDRGVRQLDPQFVVAEQPHDRAHFDDGFELDVARFLAGGDLDLRRRDDVDVVGLDRLDVVLGQRVAQRLLARGVGTEARFEQLARRLAGTEAGHAHLARQLLERAVDGPLEFVGRDRDPQLDLVAVEFLDRALHKEEGVYPAPNAFPTPGETPRSVTRAS